MALKNGYEVSRAGAQEKALLKQRDSWIRRIETVRTTSSCSLPRKRWEGNEVSEGEYLRSQIWRGQDRNINVTALSTSQDLNAHLLKE
jgi:hypothetical protein